MVRDNFYILLELPFDPPASSPAQIKQALHKKKQEWTRWQADPERRGLALAYLELIPEMEAALSDPDQRQREAEHAVTLRGKMLRQYEAELRILEGKGYVLPREAAALSVKYKAYGVDQDRVASDLHCPVADKPTEPEADQPIHHKVLGRDTARIIHRNLALLGLPDLYAFLGEPSYAALRKLQDAAQQKRREGVERSGKDNAATIVLELAGLCIQLLVDADGKERYDHWLTVGRYPELCDMVDQEHARSGYISPEMLLRLVNFGVEKYQSKVLETEEAIRQYCAAYDIPVDSQSRLIPCPACGNKTERDGVVCAICSAPLQGDCPGCGAPFQQGPGVCVACGFSLGTMVKALHFLGDAENALIENNWSTAQRSLQYAHRYWPGHPRLEALDKRTVLLEERYAHYADSVTDCVSHNQYYAALELIIQAASRHIQLPLATVAHVEKVVADLEDAIAALGRKPGPPPFEDILQLADTVADSMELNHLMRSYPPAAPTKIIASTQHQHVRLTWSISESAGYKEYIVVRGAERVPMTSYDGDILYEGPANSFQDKTATPLTSYYYAIYVRRGGAVSDKAAVSEPVLVIPEIENLRMLPTDQGAQLTWAYNPDIREVVLWRKLGGDRPTGPEDGIRLNTQRLDGFTDSRIKNGVEYWYFLVAAYLVNGEKVYSKGVCDSIIPHKMLAPIEQLAVVKTDVDEDEYVANWHSDQYSDVLLLASPKNPACHKGDRMAVKELLEQYRKLDIDARQPSSARFRYSWNGGMYLFVAAVSGAYATVGEIRYIPNVKDVVSPTFNLVDKSLFLNMEWPEGLTEIAVAYRLDHYPEAPEESGATLLRCTREQYDYDHGVCLSEPEPVVYYITIFAAFITPEGERVYSKGVNVQINNTAQQEIFYKFTRTKRFFSSVSTITATISGAESFVLPKAVIVGKVGRLPLSKTDGLALFEVDRETKVDSSVVYEYRTSSLPDNLYLRLFLQDESKYDHFRPLPVSKLKMT